MIDTDWRDYLNDAGFFEARFPAQAVADDLTTVTGAATIEVTASAGREVAGVVVAFVVPMPPRHAASHETVWFDVDTAREYATAVADAVAAPAQTATQLHGWSTWETFVPVQVHVSTGRTAVDGVYLDMFEPEHGRAAVLVARDDAAYLAQVIHAAASYLTATSDSDQR